MTKALVSDLFDIVYGQKRYHNKEWLEGDEGDGILISSKGEDNGLYGFYNIPAGYKAPFITVPGYGTIGQAFVQERDCSVDDHLLVLIPKVSLDLYDLYQVAYQIRKLKWKYKYGRGITPDRLAQEEVTVNDFKKDWRSYEQQLTPSAQSRQPLEANKDIRWVKVPDVCAVDRTYALYVNQLSLDEEKVPYITTTERNNGVSVFCGEQPTSPANTLTVALDGKCGETFYQLTPFISGEKTAILSHENKFLLVYVGACIKLLSWKFHYGRKLSMERLKEMYIPVPYKNDAPDTAYMEAVVRNSYGFDVVKEHL